MRILFQKILQTFLLLVTALVGVYSFALELSKLVFFFTNEILKSSFLRLSRFRLSSVLSSRRLLKRSLKRNSFMGLTGIWPIYKVPLQLRSFALDRPKPVLVLDLNRTLVYTRRTHGLNLSLRFDIKAKEKLNSELHNSSENLALDSFNTFSILYRPYLNYFLSSLQNFYSIFVFTTAVAKYADPIVERIAAFKAITKRFYRSSCFKRTLGGKTYYEKNYSVLGNSKKPVVVVDDNVATGVKKNFVFLNISKFHGDIHDEELKNFLPILVAMSYCSDFTELFCK